MANGIVTNVSRNPVELPDGSTLGPGETRENFDESTLSDENLFVKGGWLVTGKDAKDLQEQLDTSGVRVVELQKQVGSLQEQLERETLRANEAQAKADAVEPGKLDQLNKSIHDLTARAEKAEADLAKAKEKK